MSGPRLLSEAELDTVRSWVRGLPGTGTGRLPEDLALLLGHVDAQAAELQRSRRREAAMRDAIDDLIDAVEQGGSADHQENAIARAREAQQA